jgi:hypothetical protein
MMEKDLPKRIFELGLVCSFIERFRHLMSYRRRGRVFHVGIWSFDRRRSIA